MTVDADRALTRTEALERAKSHELRAQNEQGQAMWHEAKARGHARWAKKWREWAEDETGQVPYPAPLSVR